MLAEHVAEPARAGAVAGQRHVDAPQQKWQPLAEMAEDDLEPRILIEGAAEDQPDALGRGLDGKAPGSPQNIGKAFDIIAVIDVDYRRMRDRRVQIQRHV